MIGWMVLHENYFYRMALKRHNMRRVPGYVGPSDRSTRLERLTRYYPHRAHRPIGELDSVLMHYEARLTYLELKSSFH